MESHAPRFAIAQMAASADLDANLDKMKALCAEARKQKTDLVAFPEMAYFLGGKEESEQVALRYPELVKLFCQWSQEFGFYLIPGTLREPDPKGSGKLYNTLPLIGPDGKVLAEYRKIFLFKANLPDRVYDEEKIFLSGQDPTVVDLPWGKTALSICYDLRFPELFRNQRARGCRVQILPAAFTVPTGERHWDALTKARAIENQVFFVAPGMEGTCGDGRITYGHSRILSPWGEILAEIPSGEGVAVVSLDMNAIREAESRVNSWASRKPQLF